MLRNTVIVIIFLVLTITVLAEVPQLINYQGRLTDDVGSPVQDGTYAIAFKIWNHPTAIDPGNELWNSGFQFVQVTDGLFSYQIGSAEQLPDDLFSGDTTCYLGITVSTDPEIDPRTKMVSSAYSYQALRADSAGYASNANNLDNQPPAYYLDWNNLSGVPAGFADGVDDDAGGDITGVDVAGGLTGGGASGDLTITLPDNSITSGHIQTDAVGSDEITDGTIQQADLSFNAIDESSTQTITGTKTFDDLNIGTTTRRLALSHAAFVPANSNDPYLRTWYSLMTTSTGPHLYYAQVSLPDGAIVTQLEGYFYDYDGTYDSEIFLMYCDPSTSSSYDMANASTSGRPGATTIVDNSIDFATIDNELFNYFIRISMTYNYDFTYMELYGAGVEYTITKPLP